MSVSLNSEWREVIGWQFLIEAWSGRIDDKSVGLESWIGGQILVELENDNSTSAKNTHSGTVRIDYLSPVFSC